MKSSLSLLLVFGWLAGCQLFFPPPSDCNDGRLNGRETDLDCGGDCAGCAQGLVCLADRDCGSGVCTVNHCAAPTCSDAVRNGDEREIDCGGSCPACISPPSCTDGQRGPAESDVDCGGPCPPCGPSAECVRDVDCQSLACTDGHCGDGCGAPLRACALSCVDPSVDPNHCGDCGVACGAGGACVAGQCRPTCSGGTLACASGCIDPASNPFNCGGCNQPCAPGEICAGGACLFPCPLGQVACGGQCVSPERDPFNCGGCNQPCGPGSSCLGGGCMPVSACTQPQTTCFSQDGGPPACVDTRYDPENCGDCDRSCSTLPHAAGACVDGGCALGGCQPGFENCNMNPQDGCEAEMLVDSANCGQCGRACFGVDFCSMGRCCSPIPAGTYQATCSGCESCNGFLTCMCNDAMQVPRPTSTPLNCAGSYTNCNGVLLCDGC